MVRRIPHDAEAFTQGLTFYQGRLYESTGLNGRSSVRVLDAMTGAVLRRREVDEEHFAEGLTVFHQIAMTSPALLPLRRPAVG